MPIRIMAASCSLTIVFRGTVEREPVRVFSMQHEAGANTAACATRRDAADLETLRRNAAATSTKAAELDQPLAAARVELRDWPEHRANPESTGCYSAGKFGSSGK